MPSEVNSVSYSWNRKVLSFLKNHIGGQVKFRVPNCYVIILFYVSNTSQTYVSARHLQNYRYPWYVMLYYYLNNNISKHKKNEKTNRASKENKKQHTWSQYNFNVNSNRNIQQSKNSINKTYRLIRLLFSCTAFL